MNILKVQCARSLVGVGFLIFLANSSWRKPSPAFGGSGVASFSWLTVCLPHSCLIRRGGLAIGDQSVNVLHAQSRVGLIEADWNTVRSGRVVDEFLSVFSARRRRWAGDELKDQVEGPANILCKIRNVLVERIRHTR